MENTKINEILLSIIIPVYNTENYLEECLDSLLNTEFKSLEIIIINDGSTDDSELILERYLNEYSFIKYIYQDNNGQGAARNVGLEQAVGKYIYFMDSDDMVSGTIFHDLIETLEEDRLDAIFFDGSSFYDVDDGKTSDFESNYSRNNSYGIYSDGESLLFEFLRNKEYTVSPCLYIFRKNIIESNSLRFEEKVIHEDELFTLKLLLAVNRCKHINNVYFYRRIRLGSTMTTIQVEKKFLGYYSVFNGFNEILEQHLFKTTENKKTFLKMTSNIFRKLIVLHKENNLSLYDTFDKIILLGKKHDYYGFLGYLAVNHFSLYKGLLKIKNRN